MRKRLVDRSQAHTISPGQTAMIISIRYDGIFEMHHKSEYVYVASIFSLTHSLSPSIILTLALPATGFHDSLSERLSSSTKFHLLPLYKYRQQFMEQSLPRPLLFVFIRGSNGSNAKRKSLKPIENIDFLT